jgi:hypothetical protein
MNWTGELLRLWLVGSMLWVVVVGWLMWPADAPQQYGLYWYYRVAHTEVLDKRRANEAAAAAERDKSIAEIRMRYNGTRTMRVESSEKSRQVTPNELDAFNLHLELGAGVDYCQSPCEMSHDELNELEKVAHAWRERVLTPPGEVSVYPESPQLYEFRKLEAERDDNERAIEWWAAYTFGPPVILLVVGASLVWALRGFVTTSGPHWEFVVRSAVPQPTTRLGPGWCGRWVAAR